MNTYRRMAMAMMTGAAGLSLAACSAGITTARPGTSPSPVASHTGSPTTAPASHSAPPRQRPAATVSLDAAIPSFPIPPGSSMVENFSCPKQIYVMVSPVTPPESSAFYSTALPKAGYKIEADLSTGTGTAQATTEIQFSGHGSEGWIFTVADSAAGASANPSVAFGSLPGDMTKNVEGIVINPPGTPDTYTCPA
ncbi:MAG TPA: hypothetical protein VMU95_16130 [Trebonia sp.]|nr:hypothetical protein [Trebonia sp.]